MAHIKHQHPQIKFRPDSWNGASSTYSHRYCNRVARPNKKLLNCSFFCVLLTCALLLSTAIASSLLLTTNKGSPENHRLRHLRKRIHVLSYSANFSTANKVDYIIPSNTSTDLGSVTHLKPFNYTLRFPGAESCHQSNFTLNENQTWIIENSTEAFLYEEINAVYGPDGIGEFHQLEVFVTKPQKSSSGNNTNGTSIIYRERLEGAVTFEFTGVAHFKYSPPPTPAALEHIVQRAFKFQMDYLLTRINENAQSMGETKICLEGDAIEAGFLAKEFVFARERSNYNIEAAISHADVMKDRQQEFPTESIDEEKTDIDMETGDINSDIITKVLEKNSDKSDPEDNDQLKMLAIVFGCLALIVTIAIYATSFGLRRYKNRLMKKICVDDHVALFVKDNFTIDPTAYSDMIPDEEEDLTHVSSEEFAYDFDDFSSIELDGEAQLDGSETSDTSDSSVLSLDSITQCEDQIVDATREDICAKYSISTGCLSDSKLLGIEFNP